jgi:hypothetical protein
MELLIAITLTAVGLLVGLLGYQLFKVIMPIVGVVAGISIGFTGFQGIFGTGAISTTIATLVAIVFGLVLAVLSYAFFDIALMILMGMAMSALFTLLGLVLGLSANGFVLGLLSLSGFIIGILVAASSHFLTQSFVTLVTAYVGSGFVLAGVFLLGSGVSLDTLVSKGVIATASTYASQSFWWILVWITGFVVMRQVQLRMILLDILPEEFAYKEAK